MCWGPITEVPRGTIWTITGYWMKFIFEQASILTIIKLLGIRQFYPKHSIKIHNRFCAVSNTSTVHVPPIGKYLKIIVIRRQIGVAAVQISS